MDLRDNQREAAFRREVRAFLDAELPPNMPHFDLFDRLETPELIRWRDALAKRGWIAPNWPREYGGAGLTAMEQFILNMEFAERDAPLLGALGTRQLGATLIIHGSEEQKQEHIPRILSGEVIWCQGYSEPGAGSDLAGLQTRAVRDGDDFVVNGQKIWSSGAHNADWMFALVRTDPEAPKHRGITYLLIDMKTPGITVRPLIDLTGERHVNETFFEDVRVPVRNVVGEVDRGWYVSTTTLDVERSSIATFINMRKEVEDYLRWLRANRAGFTAANYAQVRHMWAEHYIEAEVATALAHRIVSMQARGEVPNAEASSAKIMTSELEQRIANTGIRTFGMWGQALGDGAPLGGRAPHEHMRRIPATIAGGSTEIMKNIIATRGLGLPRG